MDESGDACLQPNDSMTDQLITTDRSNSLDIANPEWQEKWKQITAFLSEKAKERRRRKTPKGIRKRREIGGGKSIEFVDRPEYQKWLDDTFPGWSIDDLRFWAESATIKGQTYPVLFNCSLTLVIIDNGVTRRLPGAGSAPVSVKEVERDNTQLLSMKNTIALTNAIKVACGWLGAFYDLRVDEEAREEAMSPPDSAQDARFLTLLKEAPAEQTNIIKEFWSKQNRASATAFLDGLEQKLKQMRETARSVNAQPVSTS